ncbi:MAG: hypothetical protein L3J59_05025 [Methylococcaceae bacterium]|nr:hypothetical protein [Methylococcaceae bacterium]
MKDLILRIMLLVSLLSLTACSSFATKQTDFVYHKVLSATSYSQLPNLVELSQSQKSSVAEQAAKLNAYRDLAKQLYKEKLETGITVAEQVILHEAYRTYLDLFLREAKVKQALVFSDQKRVVLELNLSRRFYYCFSNTVNVVIQCLNQDNKIAFTRVGYQQVPMTVVNLDCISSDCNSQLSVSGFSKKKNSVDSAMLDYGLYDSEWTINMTVKSAFRYFGITKANF